MIDFDGNKLQAETVDYLWTLLYSVLMMLEWLVMNHTWGCTNITLGEYLPSRARLVRAIPLKRVATF